MAALLVCALHARELFWVGLRACLSQRSADSALQTALGVLSAPLAYGGTAVPLFFVISGYCIHRSFAAKLADDPNHEPHWRDYFLRRAWRIYPILIAVLLITSLLDPFTVQRYPLDPKLGSLSLRTFLVNLCALQGLAGPAFGSNGPLWSLSIEMQLYAAYPLVFFMTKRMGIKSTLLGTLAFSMFFAAVACLPSFRSVLWFGPYWFSWTLGCAVAEILGSRSTISLGHWPVRACLIIAAVGFGLWLTPYAPIAFSCVSCFWALVIVKCLQVRIANVPSWPIRLFAKLGIISYSLYAVHKPVLLFGRSLLLHGSPSRNILLVLPAMIGCILVAAGLYYSVERYSLRLPRWLRSA